MPEQPDDLVTKLAEVIDAAYTESLDAARAVVARTDLVVPLGDAVPRQEHEQVVALVGSAAHALAEAHALRRNIRYIVDRWDGYAPEPLLSDLRALVAGGES